MGNLTYSLIVDMGVRGSLAPAMEKVGMQGRSIEGSFAKMGDLAKSVGSTMADAFTGAVEKAGALTAKLATVGAAAGFGAATYGVVKLNNELEQTEVSLGAILNASGKSNGMVEGMSIARDLMKDMRKDANELKGETSDLMNIFRLSATPGFQLGASAKEMEKMSALAMSAGGVLGMPLDQVGREFSQLLQGHAGGHNVFGSLLGFTGDKAQSFNQLGGKERLGAISAELAKYDGANKVMATTFDALSSTMQSNAKLFIGGATAGLFEKVKHSMADANAWFDKNETTVNSWGIAIGSRLEYAFEIGKQKLLEWGPVMLDFGKGMYAEFQKVEKFMVPLLAKIEPLVKRFAENPAGGIEKTAMLYGATKVGQPLLTGGMKLAAAQPEIAAAAAAAAAIVAGSAYLVSSARDTNSGERDWVKMTESFGKVETNFGAAFDKLGPMFTSLGHDFEILSQTVGGMLIKQLEGLTFILEKVSGPLVKVAELAAKGAGESSFFDDYLSANAKALGFKEKDPTQESMDDIHARRSFEIGSSLVSAAGFLDPKKEEKNRTPPITGGGMNIQKVEIVISSNQDPSRIARLTVDELRNLSRFQTSSRFTKNASAAR